MHHPGIVGIRRPPLKEGTGDCSESLKQAKLALQGLEDIIWVPYHP